ncbi:hypothetical protein N9N28_10640 [Rubripirellula amarantea]|uniref:Uncharacterized protein n=1 Tax=Rubripirellula amarantea TaxID=2527999 RepID=A0A5C5WPW9_9BACT|nr:hypothetical protein [Rubripirellula amarantea]MDA8745078.1 hypothetical protein [Rubripirellula amarantea]TWT52924.1 hypothetical protein Pla22_05520 [Rubripirellula amarantea]
MKKFLAFSVLLSAAFVTQGCGGHSGGVIGDSNGKTMDDYTTPAGIDPAAEAAAAAAAAQEGGE